MASFKEIIEGMDWTYPLQILQSVLPALVCIMVHEICHGLAALALGDHTAETQGRLSLNPLHHIDAFGLLMLVLFKIGWAKPVNVNMMNFKNPKRGMALTALAGPASNFVLAVLMLFVYGLCYSWLYNKTVGSEVLTMIELTAYISVSLGLFNLIPFPPLDGSKVLFSFFPEKTYMKLMRYERYGMLVLIVLVFGLSRFGINPIGAAASFVFDKLFAVAQWSFELVSR